MTSVRLVADGTDPLVFEALLLLKTIAAHRPVNYGQLQRLAAATPITNLRGHLNDLLDGGLIRRNTVRRRCYEPTEQGARRSGMKPPVEPVDVSEWIVETDMCLQFMEFGRRYGRTVVWWRSRDGVYDLAVTPRETPGGGVVEWAIPAPGTDHAMIPLVVKYVRSVRLDSDLFDWAAEASRVLYREKQWETDGFSQPPALVLLLRGHAAEARTEVEYAHSWRDVLSAVVPGTSESYREMFAGVPAVLIANEKPVKASGPAAKTASLTHWAFGGLWQTHQARTGANAA